MRKQIIVARAPGRDFPEPGPVIADAALLIAAHPHVIRCIVHVYTPEPAASPIGNLPSPDGANCVLELWSEGGEGFSGLGSPFEQATVHPAREIVEKGPADFAPGAIPGVTLVAVVAPRPGVSIAEARRRYDRHPLVALHAHGMDTYVRNQLDEDGEGSPDIFAFSALYFPSDDALVDRLYVVENGQRIIADDVSGFMDPARSISMKARSHVLK